MIGNYATYKEYKMARPKITNTEKMLKFVKKSGGATRLQMVKFMLRLDRNAPAYGTSLNDRGLYSATLYGTSKRTGVLERFCKKNKSGKYVVVKKLVAPFTTSKEL